ncbi:FAD-dependent oxidoreductase [Pseudonocardia sp. TRM90224]|uniref:FAD-dependent oxidoreductase n=1 Tax=Pseudonocardia sp. TRM90224 TaxID=2812678 RepID=UPI001E28B3BB|nr:FAD-dependent oxidoreductase [Pseudonocardia sp. TRM90224]
MTGNRADDVVVVGAGISGLAAGHRLVAAGYRVTVLEAATGPGGRMATRPVGAGLMELGAQFLSTDYELVPELVRTAGLAGQEVTVSGRSMVVADGRSWRFDTDRPWTFLTGGLVRARDIVREHEGCGRPARWPRAAGSISSISPIWTPVTGWSGCGNGSAPA